MTYQTSNATASPRRRTRGAARTKARFSVLPLGLLLAGCGGERLSVGSNEEPSGVESNVCDGGVNHHVLATQQQDIDALRGCEVIDASLQITGPAELSLAPLASLRLVRGSMAIEGVASLEGLENLVQVGNLTLHAIGSTYLGPLSNLQRVIWDPPGGGDGGIINIVECPNLQNLGGLEHLTTWTSLHVQDDPALETLEGLAGPPTLREILLSDLPVLANLSGLGFARNVDSVDIRRTGIRIFDGFPLALVGVLQLVQNPDLRNLDDLDQLYKADQLLIDDNDRLYRITLPALEELQGMRVTGNDDMTSFYGCGCMRSAAESADPSSAAPSRLFFEVGNNARLTSFSYPLGFTNVQRVAIWDNPNLYQTQLFELERADSLTIRDNATLRDVYAESLERVGDLEIVNNPAFYAASFNDVKTFTTTISGNRETPDPYLHVDEPLAPVP